MDKATPKCPWCGKEMEPDRSYKSMLAPGVGRMFWYSCDPCGSVSPRCDSPESAYFAAMARWVEPNRVLTLEEVAEMDDSRSIYFETNGFGSDRGAVFESSVVCAQETFCDEDESAYARKEYGVKVRCWLRRPTDEERKAVGWG